MPPSCPTVRSGNAFMSTGSNEPGKLCLVVRQDVHLARKYSENVRGGTLFVTTAHREDGKQSEVGLWNVHLVQKCGECVRGGTLFVTTAHREDGKQRKVYALFVIPIGRLILIPTGRRPMVTFWPILFVIPTDRREWRNLPGELRRSPAAGNAHRSG